VTRDVAGGRETPLPEWNNFGTTWIRGLKMAVIQLLYILPIYVLFCPLFVAVTAANGGSPEGELTSAAAAILGCGVLLLLLLGLALAPVIMAASARFAVTDRFSEALPGPTLAMLRGHWQPWLIAILYLLGAGVVITVASACSFGLLAIPISFYVQLVAAHWYAQAYRASAGTYSLPPTMV
jgi:hypothetical protein